MPAPNPSILASLLSAPPAEALSPELLGHLPPPVNRRKEAGSGQAPYVIPDPLSKAAQVALLLGQPLLLTGDPGVGKTAFAAALSGRLRLGAVEAHTVRSTTVGRDLLYEFDDVRRFRDASVAARPAANGKSPGSAAPAKPLASYVRLNALGLAVVRSAGPDYQVLPTLPLSEVAGSEARGAQITLGDLFPRAFAAGPAQQRRTVVLIDEIDKAPRDAPNDLLAEIEGMRFAIPELGIGEIAADVANWPIVVITSNSERNLPDAFLRRCCFHHLELPDDKTLGQIVLSHVDPERLPEDCSLLNGLIRIFRDVGGLRDLEKKPSTSELIAAAFLLVDLGFAPDREPWTDARWLGEDEPPPPGGKPGFAGSGVAAQVAATLAKKRADRDIVTKSLIAKAPRSA